MGRRLAGITCRVAFGRGPALAVMGLLLSTYSPPPFPEGVPSSGDELTSYLSFQRILLAGATGRRGRLPRTRGALRRRRAGPLGMFLGTCVRKGKELSTTTKSDTRRVVLSPPELSPKAPPRMRHSPVADSEEGANGSGCAPPPPQPLCDSGLHRTIQGRVGIERRADGGDESRYSRR